MINSVLGRKLVSVDEEVYESLPNLKFEYSIGVPSVFTILISSVYTITDDSLQIGWAKV